MNEILYGNVKRIAKERNITLRELEDAAHLGNGSIGKWKTVSPKINTIEKVAVALNVPISMLLEK